MLTVMLPLHQVKRIIAISNGYWLLAAVFYLEYLLRCLSAAPFAIFVKIRPYHVAYTAIRTDFYKNDKLRGAANG